MKKYIIDGIMETFRENPDRWFFSRELAAPVSLKADRNITSHMIGGHLFLIENRLMKERVRVVDGWLNRYKLKPEWLPQDLNIL